MSSLKINAFSPVAITGSKGIDTRKLKLFIGGLLQKHTSKDLHDLFIKYGPIRESVVIPHKCRVPSTRYGFITFESESSVRETLNNGPIITNEGIRLTVILASANTKQHRHSLVFNGHGRSYQPLPILFENDLTSISMRANKNKISIGGESSVSKSLTASNEDFKNLTKNQPNKSSKKLKLSIVKVLKKIEVDIAALRSIDFIGCTNGAMVLGINGIIVAIIFNLNWENRHKNIPDTFVLSTPIQPHINVDPKTGWLSPNMSEMRHAWSKKDRFPNKLFELLSNIQSVCNGGCLKKEDILNKAALYGHSLTVGIEGEISPKTYGAHSNGANYEYFINFQEMRKEMILKQDKLDKIHSDLENGLLFN